MTKCKTVRIKFVAPGLPQEELSALQTTGAAHIEVHRTDGFLELNFTASGGQLVKSILYRIADVRELVCESIVWEVKASTHAPQGPDTVGTATIKVSGIICEATGCYQRSPCGIHK
jgi:hypothetical protein